MKPLSNRSASAALRLLFLTAFVALAGLAPAHPGHGMLDQGPGHVVGSPYHLAMLALTGGVLLIGARWVEQKLPRRVMQVVGTLTLLATTTLLPW